MKDFWHDGFCPGPASPGHPHSYSNCLQRLGVSAYQEIRAFAYEATAGNWDEMRAKGRAAPRHVYGQVTIEWNPIVHCLQVRAVERRQHLRLVTSAGPE